MLERKVIRLFIFYTLAAVLNPKGLKRAAYDLQIWGPHRASNVSKNPETVQWVQGPAISLAEGIRYHEDPKLTALGMVTLGSIPYAIISLHSYWGFYATVFLMTQSYNPIFMHTNLIYTIQIITGSEFIYSGMIALVSEMLQLDKHNVRQAVLKSEIRDIEDYAKAIDVAFDKTNPGDNLPKRFTQIAHNREKGFDSQYNPILNQLRALFLDPTDDFRLLSDKENKGYALIAPGLNTNSPQQSHMSQYYLFFDIETKTRRLINFIENNCLKLMKPIDGKIKLEIVTQSMGTIYGPIVLRYINKRHPSIETNYLAYEARPESPMLRRCREITYKKITGDDYKEDPQTNSATLATLPNIWNTGPSRNYRRRARNLARKQA